MSRWKPVRDGLDPSVVRFVVELRKTKDASGLSLTQLAHRTGRSPSSWERYLDGRGLAPYEAVESLTKLVDADQTAVMALYWTAKDAWHPTTPGDKISSLHVRGGKAIAAAGGPTGPMNEREGVGEESPIFSPRTVIRLADELKALRERTGLGLVALASNNRYSKSSWSRWLGTKALPPWHAVQALCALVGEPETDLRALWKLAEQEWSRREVVAAARVPSTPVFPSVAVPEDEMQCTVTKPDSRRFLAGLLAFAAELVLGGVVLSPVVARWLLW